MATGRMREWTGTNSKVCAGDGWLPGARSPLWTPVQQLIAWPSRITVLWGRAPDRRGRGVRARRSGSTRSHPCLQDNGGAASVPPSPKSGAGQQPAFHALRNAITSTVFTWPSPLKSASSEPTVQAFRNASTSRVFTVPSASKSPRHRHRRAKA